MLRLIRRPLTTNTQEEASIIFEDYRNNTSFSITLEEIKPYKTAAWLNDKTGTRYPVQRFNKFTIGGVDFNQGYVNEELNLVTIYIDAPSWINIRRGDVQSSEVIQEEYKQKAKRKVSILLEDVKRKVKKVMR